MEMEDVLEGITMPRVSIGSITLLILTVACLALAIYSVLLWLRFITKKIRQGFDIKSVGIAIAFPTLIALTMKGGIYFYRDLIDFQLLAFHVVAFPPWDMMSYGIAVQGLLGRYLAKAVAFTILYAGVCTYFRGNTQ